MSCDFHSWYYHCKTKHYTHTPVWFILAKSLWDEKTLKGGQHLWQGFASSLASCPRKPALSPRCSSAPHSLFPVLSLSLHAQVAASNPISKPGFGQGWQMSSSSPPTAFPSSQGVGAEMRWCRADRRSCWITHCQLLCPE